MVSRSLVERHVFSADRLLRPIGQEARWCLDEVRGRLVELSSGPQGGASLSLAFHLIADTLWQGEPAAWISGRRESFYPPDVAEWGLPLARLPVIRVDSAQSAARAASHLVRSGGFGLVVLDLGRVATIPTPLSARLVKQAQRHDAAVVFLTEKDLDAPSIGSLISLRCASRIERAAVGRFRVQLQSLKDKRRPPGWTVAEVHRGPRGLR